MTRRTDQKHETRARLIEVARATFRTDGYDATTLQRVATAAGVAVGTVVAHFPDKPRLALAAFHAELEHASVAGLRAMASESALPDGYVALARPLYQLYASDPLLFRRMVQESLFLDQDGPMGQQLQAFLGAVAAQVARLRPDLDPHLAARGFFADYFIILIAGLAGTFPPDPEVWLSHLRALANTRLGPWANP